MTDGRKALLFARGILLECGRELMRRRLESLGEVEEKTGYDDVVTPNDRWAQDFICGQLQKRFPSHGILGEEGAEKKGESPWLWVLDPIDGTTNFIHLGRLYAISLGLYHGDKPYGGLVLDVEQGRVYEGLEKPVSLPRGEAGQCRRSLLHLGYKTMENLAAMGCDPLALPRQFRGVRYFGCASLEMCSLPEEESALYLHTHLKPWDFAAAVPVLHSRGWGVTVFPMGDKSYFVAAYPTRTLWEECQLWLPSRLMEGMNRDRGGIFCVKD